VASPRYGGGHSRISTINQKTPKMMSKHTKTLKDQIHKKKDSKDLHKN